MDDNGLGFYAENHETQPINQHYSIENMAIQKSTFKNSLKAIISIR